jgi:hypothetical protein
MVAMMMVDGCKTEYGWMDGSGGVIRWCDGGESWMDGGCVGVFVQKWPESRMTPVCSTFGSTATTSVLAHPCIPLPHAMHF